MPYCKHCNEFISESQTTHSCPKVGFLDISDDSSFIVSAAIAAVTDSAELGAMLGGDALGGLVGDLLDGCLGD